MTNITDLTIAYVAPPLAGHLFPQLQLARYLKSQGFDNQRFFSCPKMQSAVEADGIGFTPILADKENEVLAISLTDAPVMSRLSGMFAMVKNTLAVMRQFSEELNEHWTNDKPDLVIVDHLSPFAGVIAEKLGIPWWTAIVSPELIEAKQGPPSFCGSLQPAKNLFGRCRNAFFRGVVRCFKKTVFQLFRKQITELGIKTIYRPDGTESYFSSEIILGLAVQELEFDLGFPKAMRWVGPCPESPKRDVPPPEYEAGKKHILITLGTQIPWAREKHETLFQRVAGLCPDTVFHFTRGKVYDETPKSGNTLVPGNLRFYEYIPYTAETFSHYDVIVHHCGIGAYYTAIEAAVPQLLLPQDFDQHDCAARLTYHGLGLRAKETPQDVVKKLQALLSESTYKEKSLEFQKIVQRYHSGKAYLELIKERFGTHE
ncbi:glycosyl transferase [Planctomycetales bacterium]|nr:glycosyl transferase [Planctomycetales bacterium]